MGERVAMNREGLMSATGTGTRTEPIRIRYASMAKPESRVVLPAKMRDARNSAAYRRPHAHKVAQCGHFEFCEGTKAKPCKTLTERRAATCDSCK